MTVQPTAPRMLDLVAEDAELEEIASGFMFTEGPIWNHIEGYLLFSDIPGDVRGRWSPSGGAVIDKRPTHKGNGMTYDGQGGLLVCEHTTSRVVREAPDGTVTVIADRWHDQELNSPNDVLAGWDGSVYFTDPSMGRTAYAGTERYPELDFQGVYRVTPAGELQLLADDFECPNGLCLTPDGRQMYVNDTMRSHIRRFDLLPDGTFGAETLFAQHIGRGVPDEGVPDGMKTDEHGNVYVTGPGGVWVFDDGGQRLGVIRVPQTVGNLNWGEDGWRTLFICASKSVYRLPMKVAGCPSVYMNR